MLEPLDRSRRDSTLFQFTTWQPRDFIDPNHLLIQIDEKPDFAKLVATLEGRYCPGFGRPAIHPEAMVRALLIRSVYNIASFWRLCSGISENLAYRWSCFLTIDDSVFNQSTISGFIERVRREGFAAIFRPLNEELLRLRLPSPETYADASLIKANASSYVLVSSGMSKCGVDGEGVRYCQDPKGKLPLDPVDTDARYRTGSFKRPAELCYQDSVIVDLGVSIVAHGVAHASQGELNAAPGLLEQLPIHPVSLTMDTEYSTGELRQVARSWGVDA